MGIWESVLTYFEGSGQWTIQSGNFRSKQKKTLALQISLDPTPLVRNKFKYMFLYSTTSLFHLVNTLICSYSSILLMLCVVNVH